MSQNFQRTIEDFKCGHCGFEIRGTGYTNHCSQCLWSKHVDVYPGDRAEGCGGLMEPVGVELDKGEYTIIHRCELCQARKKNKAAGDDDIGGFLANMLK